MNTGHKHEHDVVQCDDMNFKLLVAAVQYVQSLFKREAKANMLKINAISK